jgi:predicted DNA-binding transcriptional regulator YafY
MRADRLISIVLLLQTHGRLTAGELAGQLEVSERTIYRDLESLGMAGVPIYSEHGPGGGYALLDSYRTTLTGLNEAEVRTLFMSGVYGPLADLGLSQALKIALMKLASSLPESQQQRVEQTRQRIYLDAVAWFQSSEAVPYLRMLQEAIWCDQYVNITYQRSDGEIRDRVIAPYGLVAKASLWYVVASNGEDMRVYRVARILSLTPLDEVFEYPADFDLEAYWLQWCKAFETSRWQHDMQLRVSPDVAEIMAGYWGDAVRTIIEAVEPDAQGWREITLRYESIESACNTLIRFGAGVKVLQPPQLRDSIIRLASDIVAFYDQPG